MAGAQPKAQSKSQSAAQPKAKPKARSTAAPGGPPDERPRGRTAPLDAVEADRLFREGVALFNGARYWHAHEAWETLWRAAPDEERDFYQGLIQVAAGFLHLARRNRRGARNKLTEGVARLQPYQPIHQGIGVTELVRKSKEVLADLNAGASPYLIPPNIRFVASTTVNR